LSHRPIADDRDLELCSGLHNPIDRIKKNADAFHRDQAPREQEKYRSGLGVPDGSCVFIGQNPVFLDPRGSDNEGPRSMLAK
jgi:hypothetical protein